jgi:hypothetical protein
MKSSYTMAVLANRWIGVQSTQGVTQRCRLSWLTNRALVYEPKCGGGGEYTGAHINFVDVTSYLTYESNTSKKDLETSFPASFGTVESEGRQMKQC